MLTPTMVHSGTAPQVLAARAQVLANAYTAHPQRCVNQMPVPEVLPKEVWINPPLVPKEASRDALGDPHAAAA